MTDPSDKDPVPDMSLAHASGRRGKRAVPDAAFDLWLRRGLHAIYDEVAREPVPEELLRLIAQDRQK